RRTTAQYPAQSRVLGVGSRHSQELPDHREAARAIPHRGVQRGEPSELVWRQFESNQRIFRQGHQQERQPDHPACVEIYFLTKQRASVSASDVIVNFRASIRLMATVK